MPAKTKTKPKSKSGTGKSIFVGEYLVVDPRVCHGELTFRGTRVPVETILRYLANGYSLAYLRKSWPEVSSEAIQEAVNLASEQLVQNPLRSRRISRKWGADRADSGDSGADCEEKELGGIMAKKPKYDGIIVKREVDEAGVVNAVDKNNRPCWDDTLERVVLVNDLRRYGAGLHIGQLGWTMPGTTDGYKWVHVQFDNGIRLAILTFGIVRIIPEKADDIARKLIEDHKKNNSRYRSRCRCRMPDRGHEKNIYQVSRSRRLGRNWSWTG